jgi:hypothetical protein
MYVVASTDFFLLLVSFRSSNRSTPGLSAFIAASGVGSFHSHLSPPSGQLGEPLAVSSLQCLVPNRFPGRSHSSFGVGSFHSHLSPPSGQLGEPLAVSSLQCLVPNRFPGRSHSSFRTPTELVFEWIITGTRLVHIIKLSDQKT